MLEYAWGKRRGLRGVWKALWCIEIPKYGLIKGVESSQEKIVEER